MQARSALGAGFGFGFRRELIEALKAGIPPEIELFEIAPENWAAW